MTMITAETAAVIRGANLPITIPVESVATLVVNMDMATPAESGAAILAVNTDMATPAESEVVILVASNRMVIPAETEAVILAG